MIRPARETDAEALAPLLAQLGYPFGSAEIAPVLAELLRDPTHHVLVAEDDGEVVGFVNANFRPHLHHLAPVGTIDELVALPFVHMEAPIYLKGRARPGPTFRETLLIHAVGRLALHPWITNVQASWVKLGPDGARAALAAGCNDLGGTLMNESISRAAGATYGQELPPEAMEGLIRSAGRVPRQRTTLYGAPPVERTRASFGAPPLAEPRNPSVNDAGLRAPKRLLRPGLAATAS